MSKIAYKLRVQGDRIATQELEAFDDIQWRSVSKTLGGSLSDHAWLQASCAISEGGLGLRRAVAVALPALLGSRTASRPGVISIIRHLEAGSWFFIAEGIRKII